MPKKDFFLWKLNVIVTLKKTFMDYKGWIIYTIIEFVSPRVILISKKTIEKAIISVINDTSTECDQACEIKENWTKW